MKSVRPKSKCIALNRYNLKKRKKYCKINKEINFNSFDYFKISNLNIIESIAQLDCFFEVNKQNKVLKKTEVKKVTTYYKLNKFNKDINNVNIKINENNINKRNIIDYNVYSKYIVKKNSKLNIKLPVKNIELKCISLDKYNNSIILKTPRVVFGISNNADQYIRPFDKSLKSKKLSIIENVIKEYTENNSFFNNSDSESKCSIHKTTSYINILNSLIKNNFYNNTFILESLLGKGGFGKVYKARHKIDNGIYAIKRIDINCKSLNSLLKNVLYVLNEVKSMMNLNNSYIVRYITCWFEEKNCNICNLSNNKILNENINSKESIISINSNINSFSKRSSSSYNNFWNNSSGVIKAAKSEYTIKDRSSSSTSSYNNKNKKLYSLKFYIQMEYSNGVPLNYILENSNYKLELNIIEDVFKQIVLGVKEIHDNGIIHRDLK